MRVRIAFLVVLVAMVSVIAASFAQPGTVLEPNDRVEVGLNVRSTPNSSAEIVAVLRPGDRVTQIGAVPYWYQIRLADGTEGWASKGYLRVAAGTAPPPPAGELDLAKLKIHFIDVGVGDAILIEIQQT